MEWWKSSGKGLKWSEIVWKQPEMVEMEMARRWAKWPRDRLGWSKMVKKGLGWPGNGLKLLEIDSEWSQVGQLNGQELGKDGEDKR